MEDDNNDKQKPFTNDELKEKKKLLKKEYEQMRSIQEEADNQPGTSSRDQSVHKTRKCKKHHKRNDKLDLKCNPKQSDLQDINRNVNNIPKEITSTERRKEKTSLDISKIIVPGKCRFEQLCDIDEVDIAHNDYSDIGKEFESEMEEIVNEWAIQSNISENPALANLIANLQGWCVQTVRRCVDLNINNDTRAPFSSEDEDDKSRETGENDCFYFIMHSMQQMNRQIDEIKDVIFEHLDESDQTKK